MLKAVCGNAAMVLAAKVAGPPSAVARSDVRLHGSLRASSHRAVISPGVAPACRAGARTWLTHGRLTVQTGGDLIRRCA